MIRTVTKIHGRRANNFIFTSRAFRAADGINDDPSVKKKIGEEISKWFNQILTVS